MPTRSGKEITLRQLATHTSGLPLLAYNLEPKRADNPYAEYTVEKLYTFLTSYQLTVDPGTKLEYSEVGMELLGHVIALKAGTNYESLVVDRICQPLNMDSTRVTLTPELKSRCVTGHNELGYSVPALQFQTLVGGSGLHSTANDLLKYVSAHLGLTKSRLTPIMEKTHANQYHSLIGGKFGLGWAIVDYPQGRKFIMHGGATPGCSTYVVFDMARRRGVVVMASSQASPTSAIWANVCSKVNGGRSGGPTATKISGLEIDSYVGEYQLSPDVAVGMLTLRAVLINVSKAVYAIAVGVGMIAILLIALLRRVAFLRKIETRLFSRWRTFNRRKRRLILGSAILISTLLTPLITARVVCGYTHPVVNIRRSGDRLFAEGTSSSRVTSKWTLPSITGELLPESRTSFFERMSGTPVIFSHDARGKVTGLAAPLFGTKLSFAKIYDQAGAPPKPPVAVKLNEKFLRRLCRPIRICPGRLLSDGINLTIWREGDRLLGKASDKNGRWGAFDIYPESETNFFFTLTVIGVQLTFIKNDKGRSDVGRPAYSILTR
jgi:CubicO group peptidase (beta-lactamase class C family)